ncbi:MAG: thioredoxin domain-containing protein, partial [Phaeodactylibacter sp.]|nr:thioredoxin domain-containing protein [Phaeodactylibacter sp.]
RERAILTTDAEGLVSVHAVEKMMGALQQQYDSQEGGFGHGAKFPNTMALELLLQYAWQAPSPEAYGQVKETVARLLQGGLHDVIGGGFARYTVDRQWRVPHFEKMLYDNALIARLLASLYKWPKAPALLEALEGALGFLEAELSHPDGGYCAGLDADTEGVEGRFYTWGYEELTSLLPDEPHWFFAYYNVSPEGNREGRNILYATAHIEAFASRLGQPADEVKTYLDNCRNTLAAARARRARPGRDEQVLLSWNALVVTAYAQAYGATGAPVYLEKAEQLLSFLDGHFRMADGGLRHIYLRDIPAFLDDYAYLIEAYIAVHAVSQRHELLEQAAVMVEETIRRFRTEQDVLFYYSQQSETILRHSPLYEEDMPAPNAVMAANMKRLGIMLGRRDWQEQAALMLNAAGSRLLETPLALASWGSLLLAEAYGMPEIAIVGPQARKTTLEANATFLGPHILMASDVPDETYPLLAHRWNEKDTLIYICRDYACQRPVKDVEEMVHNLRGEEK